MTFYRQQFASVSTLTIVCLLAAGIQAGLTAKADDPQPELVQVTKIWDQAPHNAFTDLVRWRDRFYCAFREGQGHAGDRGKLRVLESATGEDWKSVALLELPEHDLRDAALSVTPDDQLMVLGGAQRTVDGQRRTGTFVSFSKDGQTFSDPEIVIPEGRWLWRVTWNQGTAYGVAYGTPDQPSSSALHRTRDGRKYETVTDQHLNAGGWPTEARVRFDDQGTAYCLHRRDGQPNTAYLGVAESPYKEWTWKDLGVRVGGPNFIQLPDGRWIGAGRLYDGRVRTSLFAIDIEQGKLTPLLDLPSGGDTSYPGLVWHDGQLWVSYYSSHTGRTSIFLAQVKFPQAE